MQKIIRRNCRINRFLRPLERAGNTQQRQDHRNDKGWPEAECDHRSHPGRGWSTFGALMNAHADTGSGTGTFEVNATCDSTGFYIKVTYLTLSPKRKNQGFITAARGNILIARMNRDSEVHNARSLPLDFINH